MNISRNTYLINLFTMSKDHLNSIDRIDNLLSEFVKFRELINSNLEDVISDWYMDYRNITKAIEKENKEFVDNFVKMGKEFDIEIQNSILNDIYSDMGRSDIHNRSEFWEKIELFSDETYDPYNQQRKQYSSFYDKTTSGSISNLFEALEKCVIYKIEQYQIDHKLETIPEKLIPLYYLACEFIKLEGKQNSWFSKVLFKLSKHPFIQYIDLIRFADKIIKQSVNFISIEIEKDIIGRYNYLFQYESSLPYSLKLNELQRYNQSQIYLHSRIPHGKEGEEKVILESIKMITEFIGIFTHNIFYSLNQQRHQLSVIREYKFRCESYDSERLRDKIENKLQNELSLFLFDKGLFPVTEYNLSGGKSRIDILDQLSKDKFLIEVKITTNNSKRPIFEGIKQIIRYFEQIQTYPNSEGFIDPILTVFLVSGSSFIFDENEIRINKNLNIQIILIDIRDKPSKENKNNLNRITTKEIMENIF